MRLIEKIKGAFRRMAADTGIAKEYKDIFELSGVPAFRQFYNIGIAVWKDIYRGYYSAWHRVNAPTIADPTEKRELFRLNLAKAVSAELAGLLWNDQCRINVNLPGFEPTDDEPGDKLQRFIDSVLDGNNFNVRMQETIEKMLALGGETLRVWYEEQHDADGNVIPDSGRIMIGTAMADQFVPTAWDNAEVKEGIFVSRTAKDGYYYTRLEWHRWNGTTYIVTNDLYRAEMRKNGAAENQDILGFRYPLHEMYPYLDEFTEIRELSKSLFSYFRTPIANNLDDNSPLGVSMYANALQTLHALDICYDSFVREFRLGKKRIIVPARCIRTVVDPQTGMERRYFDASDESYEALPTDDVSDLQISEQNVNLRVEEHVSAINAFLSILCLQLGFSASTFTFDAQGGLKTATEVVSENSKTYKTVKACQGMISPAVCRMVENIIAVAILYDVQFDGERVASWFPEGIDGGYECSIYWDDGITQDRQTNINEGILLTGAGLMSKKRFLMETLGMTEAQADAELEAIRNESRIDVPAVDGFQMD